MAVRQKVIKVVVNDGEHSKAHKYANSQGISVSELFRDFIKTLPNSI